MHLYVQDQTKLRFKYLYACMRACSDMHMAEPGLWVQLANFICVRASCLLACSPTQQAAAITQTEGGGFYQTNRTLYRNGQPFSCKDPSLSH